MISAGFGGHSVTYTYDTLGHRTALNRSSGANTAYGFEPDGDLASIAHHFTGGAPAAFTYGHDAAGRILSIDTSRPDMSWQPSEAYARSFGAANAVNQVASMAGRSLSFDPNGNLTAHDGWTYEWTFGNRLIRARRAATVTEFAYDSDDRRTVVIADGVMTRTLWSGADEIGEYDTSGTLVRRFIPDGTGAPDARLATANVDGLTARDVAEAFGVMAALQLAQTGSAAMLSWAMAEPGLRPARRSVPEPDLELDRAAVRMSACPW